MDQQEPMIITVFRNRYDAEKAFDHLYGMGYRDNEINVMMSDSTRSLLGPSAADEGIRHPAGNLATEGMGVGGAIGTAVGATLAAVAALGTTIALPGLGLVIAGPIAAALAGGGAGAVTGGLIGALVGIGMTEQNVEAYQEALRNGGVVIGIYPRNNQDASDIMNKLEELGGENVCQV